MAVRSKEEILERVRSLIGDRTDDEALTIIEDVNDTFSDREVAETEDWRAKYEESERTWRQRYRDRFFQTPANTETTREEVLEDNKEDLEGEGKVKDFDELFEEKEDNSGY